MDASGDLIVPDSDEFKFGTGGDMKLYHDGSNSFIQQSGTGALKLATEDSGKAVSIGHTTSETTVNDNLTVTGNLSVTGTGDNTPSFGVSLSGNQSIDDTTQTKITFDTVIWDTDNAFDESSDNRFVVPAGEGGKYVFSSYVMLDGTPNGAPDTLLTSLFKNNADLAETYHHDTSGNNAETRTQTTWLLELAAADYIELYVYQDFGDTYTVRSAYTRFFGYKLAGV